MFTNIEKWLYATKQICLEINRWSGSLDSCKSWQKNYFQKSDCSPFWTYTYIIPYWLCFNVYLNCNPISHGVVLIQPHPAKYCFNAGYLGPGPPKLKHWCTVWPQSSSSPSVHLHPDFERSENFLNVEWVNKFAYTLNMKFIFSDFFLNFLLSIYSINVRIKHNLSLISGASSMKNEIRACPWKYRNQPPKYFYWYVFCHKMYRTQPKWGLISIITFSVTYLNPSQWCM